MSKYNLIRNGSLQALTVSGTGNKSLDWNQLESLMDGTTTSGGVTTTSGDSLWLLADMSNRIKLDEVRLYADDLTKLSNIDFYYKNNESDSYTLCSKNVGTYYYPTLPDPKAPRFILTTISGVDIQLYEYMAINDDYIVAFGADGSEYAKYLDNTPIGETGDATAVAIYNNSAAAMPADAYVCIDWTTSSGDEYVKISSAENETYYGVRDGALIEDNKENSAYRWDMGLHDNTTVSGDNVILSNVTISGGVYTTPILGLDNKYMASYFIIDENTVSGTTNISYNANVYNGTIRVRSSDTKPINVDEVYWFYRNSGYANKVFKGIVYNGVEDDSWATWITNSVYYPVATAVDRRTGYVAISGRYYIIGQYGYLYIYDHSGNLLYDTHPGPLGRGLKFRCDLNLEFDKYGGLWGYGDYYYLIHVNNQLDTVLYEGYDGTDFVYDLAAEMNGDGVWYTNQIDDTVEHRNSDGTLLHQIALNQPRAICGTSDNGCWVIDNTDDKAYRYNSSGSLVSTVTLSRDADRMTSDMNDGFWYLEGNHVYHVTSVGVEDVDVGFLQPTKIKGGYSGCIVWSENQDYVKYINNNGVVVRTFTDPGGASITVFPALFSFRHDDAVDFQNTTNIIPDIYDPVWGTGGSLSWKEVRKDGYFLPKDRYHQVEITLRNNDGSSTPYLNGVIMSPAIKVQSIQPQSSKNMYIKTEIPQDAGIDDYETRLKAWWGINL